MQRKNVCLRKVLAAILTVCFFFTSVATPAYAQAPFSASLSTDEEWNADSLSNSLDEPAQDLNPGMEQEIESRPESADSSSKSTITFYADGKEQFEKATEIQASYDYYSQLDEEETEFICEHFSVRAEDLQELEENNLTLAGSILYAQMSASYGFTIQELLANCPTTEDSIRLDREMKKYLMAVGQGGTDFDRQLRQIILRGMGYEELTAAYAVSKALEMDIQDLVAEAPSQVQAGQKTAASQTAYQGIAQRIGLDEQALSRYAAEKNISAERLAEYLEEQSAYEAEMMVLASSSYLSDPVLPGVENAIIPTDQVTAPYSYDSETHEFVNQSTGAFTYQIVDATLPGKNGLDLVIARRYNSDDAKTRHPKVNFAYGTVGSLCTWWYEAYYVHRQTGAVGNYNSQDQGPYYRDFDTFSEAQSFINNLDLSRREYILNDQYLLRLEPDYTIRSYNKSTHGIGYRQFFSNYTQDTYLNNLYGLGNGWGFAFSSIETIQDTKILRLSDGRSFEIDITATAGDSNLKDHKLSDLRLDAQSGGYSGATHTLYYQDGKREFFDSAGRLIAIKDRYDNTITLTHSILNGLPRITIVDTLNRTIVISGQQRSGGHTMTVTLPIGSLKYTVDAIDDYYGEEIGGYALIKFENQMSHATHYSYNVTRPKYNLYAKGIVQSNSNYEIDTVIGMDRENNEILLGHNINPHILLNTITHPATSSNNQPFTTSYAYNEINQNLGKSGAQEHVSLSTRYDQEDGEYSTDINKRFYSRGTGMEGYPDGYSRFPSSSGPDDLPSNYVYNTTVRENGVRTVTEFDYKHRPFRIVTIEYETCYAVELREYNDDDMLIKVTKKDYVPFNVESGVYNPWTGAGTEPAYVATITMYEYDNNATAISAKKGNVTAAWSPLANGNKTLTQYKTTYTYDSRYGQPLTKSYYQKSGTLVLENYTLTSTGKDIMRVEVKNNGVTQSKTEYDYDSYGNITAEKRYKDGLASYDQTSYSYSNGAYLSAITQTGVKDANGANVTGTPGYTAGTVVIRIPQYDAMGRIKQMTDARNQTTSYTYNALGDLTLQTNPGGSTIGYTYNYIQNYVIVTDEKGNQVKHQYYPSGLEKEVVDVQSNTVLSRKTYDDFSNLATETDALLSTTTTHTYDTLHRPVSKKTVGTNVNEEETYSYDYSASYSGERLLKIQKTLKDNRGLAPNIVTAQYINNMGLVRRESRRYNNVEYFDTYTYDYVGNKTQEQLAYAAAKGLTFSAKWEYDHAGRVTKSYNADNGYVTNAYNALGQLATFTDYNGTATSYTYDAMGRLLEERGGISQSGGSTYNRVKQYGYDQGSNVILTRVANNAPGTALSWARTEYDYTARGWLEYVTTYNNNALNQIGSVTKYTYDLVGNTATMRTGMSSKTATDGKLTAYTYDRFGNLASLTDPLSQTEQYSYDAFGRLLEKTDRNNFRTVYALDGLGRARTVTVTTPEGTLTNTFSYTLNGAKASESNANLSVSYQYDALGRLQSTTENNGVTKTYSYDLANNRLTFLAKLGSTTVHNAAYTYDNQNRLKTVKDNGATKATYNYNSNGARESLVYANGNTTYYTYNLANWLTALENRKGTTAISRYDYTYYADGNQRTKTDHNNRTTTYVYDGLGRLTQESESTGFQVAYAYDKQSNRQGMTVSGPESYTVTYDYDANNRLLKDTKVASGLTTISNYRYDPNGNQISKWQEQLLNSSAAAPPAPVARETAPLAEESFDADYAELQELLPEIAETSLEPQIQPAQDDAGMLEPVAELPQLPLPTELSGQTEAADAADALLPAEPELDMQAGEQVLEHESPNAETQALLAAGTAAAGLDATGTALYEYDGLNQLVRVTIDGQQISYTYRPDGLRHSKIGDSTVTHLWDGTNIVADLNNGIVANRYLRGVNLILSDSTAGQKYYLFNGHGDVVQLANTSGTVLWNYDYDAFGNERAIAGQNPALDTNPFRYCGEYFDQETGTVYLRARYYDPVNGRFTAEDPIRDGLNWYIYCGNNPIAYIDPLGLDAILINKAVDNPAKYIGVEHTSGFFQDENDDWWYFSWEDTVRYVQVSDTSIFDSLDTINAWIVDNGLSTGENPYRDSVYIKGDFTASNNAASDYYDAYIESLETWNGKGLANQKYNLVTKNCGQVAVELLRMGTLPSGMNVGDYMSRNGHGNAVIPNWNMINIQEAFYNKSTNLAGFNEAMQTQRAKYEGKNSFIQWWYSGLKSNIDAIS